MNIAIIAHDRKKDDLVQFVTAYKPILRNTICMQQEQLGKELKGYRTRSYEVSIWSTWWRPANWWYDC